MKRHLEHVEQVRLFQWAKMMSKKYPELSLMFAIPNESYGGGKLAIIRGKFFKAEGRKAGVPDIFLPVPRQGFHGLFIEMKKPKQFRPSVSDSQKEWLKRLNAVGYKAVVCYGFEDAKKVICKYLILEC